MILLHEAVTLTLNFCHSPTINGFLPAYAWWQAVYRPGVPGDFHG